MLIFIKNICLKSEAIRCSSLSVRDWSGILCERSEQRYSGKPDGFAGTPKGKTTRLQDYS